MPTRTKHHELRELARQIDELAVSMGVEIGAELREIGEELRAAEHLHRGERRERAMEQVRARLASLAESVRTEAQLRHASAGPPPRRLTDPRD